MEYTVKQLAEMAGVSARTLRYYDQIGLLSPNRTGENGYRIYTTTEAERLQSILFYRELGFALDFIKEVLDKPGYDKIGALKKQRRKLNAEKERIEVLIRNLYKTIAMAEGRTKMSDKERFEGFKKKMIADNERKYGEEIRQKYGEEVIERSNKKLKDMTREQYEGTEALSREVNETIKRAFETGDPGGELAQQACELHKQWLLNFWDKYSKEAHMDLAQMYVDDARFTAYYDKIAPGCTVFLRDAIRIYTSDKSI